MVATPVIAQQQATLALKPNSGAPGSGFTAGWTGVFLDPDCTTSAVQVLWDGQRVIGSGTTTRGSGQASVKVPSDATAGGHRVTAKPVCVGSAASNTYTVIIPIPPTTTTTAPPVTTTTPRPPVTTTTTRPRPTTTTTPPTTTTTTTTDTTTVPPTTTTTPSAGDGTLVLDKDNIQPGDELTATGTGCPTGATVTLKALNSDVGKAIADPDGAFRAPVRFSTIEPGRHQVRAECGITLLGSVDVTLSRSSGGTTSTLVVLLFFLLIGATMLRRQFTGLRTNT